jgi:hypothetical protein
MKENFTNAQSDPLVAAAAKILSGQIDEASNFVSKGIYTLDGKKVMGSRSSKLFLMAKDSDDNLHDLSWKEWSQLNVTDTSSDAIKKEFINRLVKQIKMFNKKVDLNIWIKSKNPSFEDTVNYIFKLDPNIKYSKTGGLKEDLSEETIEEDKKVTSEKSQFGGFRPKIINGDGSVFFLGSQAFKTSQEAEKAAQYYLDQYEKGVNTNNIKMMKGTYVEESDNLGTATIVAPGNKYHGKTVRVFHKFDDGRINVQYKKSDKKGDLVNLTLNKGQYKLEEETIDEALKTPIYPRVRAVMKAAEDLDEDELEELFFTLSNFMIYNEFDGMKFDDRLHDEVGAHLFRAAKTWKNRNN